MKKWEVFSLRTVRKKLLMVSKLAGIALVFSYIVSARLPLDSNTAFLLWFLFVVGLMSVHNPFFLPYSSLLYFLELRKKTIPSCYRTKWLEFRGTT